MKRNYSLLVNVLLRRFSRLSFRAHAGSRSSRQLAPATLVAVSHHVSSPEVRIGKSARPTALISAKYKNQCTVSASVINLVAVILFPAYCATTQTVTFGNFDGGITFAARRLGWASAGSVYTYRLAVSHEARSERRLIASPTEYHEHRWNIARTEDSAAPLSAENSRLLRCRWSGQSPIKLTLLGGIRRRTLNSRIVLLHGTAWSP